MDFGRDTQPKESEAGLSREAAHGKPALLPPTKGPNEARDGRDQGCDCEDEFRSDVHDENPFARIMLSASAMAGRAAGNSIEAPQMLGFAALRKERRAVWAGILLDYRLCTRKPWRSDPLTENPAS